jgi:GTPase SAR1 family protein
MSDVARLQLVLVSHTNSGKTTLARTLLGYDVGEVRDAPHVTALAEAHTLLQSEAGDTLTLWDTPGFGDSLRLWQRLALSGNPIGWLLREVVDRYRDRPFWLSQQALRTARDAADVVLYLVNAAEDPHDAGYLESEMKILAWLGKPVLVLLNQIGAPRPPAEELAEQERWRKHLSAWPLVREVLALDSFARCWVHERVFYEALARQLGSDRQLPCARLLASWEASNRQRFAAAITLMAEQLAAAASDQEVLANAPKSLLNSALKAVGLVRNGDQARQEAAMNKLLARQNASILDTTARLLALHKLDPGAATTINSRVRDNFVLKSPIDTAQAGLLGAVLSGAATGLSADLMAGGLTAGAGAILGGVVGALTFAGAAWGFNASSGTASASMELSAPFLHSLAAASILRYLAVAHFGRGRGNFVDSEAPAFWQAEVEQALVARKPEWEALWTALRKPDGQAKAELHAMLEAATNTVLARLYPQR